jgi:ribonuclease III
MRDGIAKALGIPPESPYLDQALTHPSFRNERNGTMDNQRLEFLGDAVLGFCVSDLLCQRFPEADEGELTRRRAALVNAEALAEWAREHQLAEAILLGRGAAASRLGEGTNVLADTVEALLAAAYLAGGLDAARRACVEVVGARLFVMTAGVSTDPKSELQEKLQARGVEPPQYEVLDTGGPAHDPWFRVCVRAGAVVVGEGRGRSKRSAERAAAANALETGNWSKAVVADGSEVDL